MDRAPASFDVPLSVPFRHRVLFTRGAFEPGNALLRSVLASDGPRGRAVVFVDHGLIRAVPGFEASVRAAFAAHGGMPELAEFAGRVSDSGEGRWTSIAAIEEGVPAPVLTAALYSRFDSRGNADFGNRVLSAMRKQFGGHDEKKD